MKTINYQKEVYYKGQLILMIMFDTMTSKGEIAVKTIKGYYNVKVSELYNIV